MGYFACAQYDGFLSPIGGNAATLSLSLRGSEATKQSPGRVGFRKAYTFSLKSWDISLALKYDVRGIGRVSLAPDKSVRAGDAFFVKKFKNLCKYRVIALKKVDGKYKIC